MHIAVSIPDMRHIVCAVGSFLFMISDISILFLYFYKNKDRKVHLFNLTTYYVGIFLLAISVIGIVLVGSARSFVSLNEAESLSKNVVSCLEDAR